MRQRKKVQYDLERALWIVVILVAGCSHIYLSRVGIDESCVFSLRGIDFLGWIISCDGKAVLCIIRQRMALLNANLAPSGWSKYPHVWHPEMLPDNFKCALHICSNEVAMCRDRFASLIFQYTPLYSGSSEVESFKYGVNNSLRLRGMSAT